MNLAIYLTVHFLFGGYIANIAAFLVFFVLSIFMFLTYCEFVSGFTEQGIKTYGNDIVKMLFYGIIWRVMILLALISMIAQWSIGFIFFVAVALVLSVVASYLLAFNSDEDSLITKSLGIISIFFFFGS